MQSVLPENKAAPADPSRARKLQVIGILSGFAAGAWLGAAEAPTKLVSVGVSPIVISLIMVAGVFLARWSVPALIIGTSSGMNPLSFVTFFTFGELGMMSALAIGYLALIPLWRELTSARDVLFWLILGGFIWVVGDVFQQYAAKYVGISRGIPLSNSNQLWGLLWGIFVFGELHGSGASTYLQVIGGSRLMMLGVAAIAFSSAAGKEHAKWQEAARRESRRYHLVEEYVDARMQGKQMAGELRPPRTVWDWILVAIATSIFAFFATLARAPRMPFHWGPAVALIGATVALLMLCGTTLWRTTRFN